MGTWTLRRSVLVASLERQINGHVPATRQTVTACPKGLKYLKGLGVTRGLGFRKLHKFL